MTTTSLRALLAQIATFEQQQRAGINPGPAALAEFFDTARDARLELDAVDRAGDARQAAPAARPAMANLERLEGDFTIRVSAPLARVAVGVLNELQRVAEARRA